MALVPNWAWQMLTNARLYDARKWCPGLLPAHQDVTS